VVSSEIRHELGCAASLALYGYDVTYLHVGEENTPLSIKEVTVDEGSIAVPFLSVKSPSISRLIISGNEFIPEKFRAEHFDLVVTTPLAPFYIAYRIAKKQKVPLLLRVWGVRAAKVFEHISIGRNYLEIFSFTPSLVHNLIQMIVSNAVIAMDDYTASFINKFLRVRRPYVIYPTYAALYEEHSFHHDLPDFVKDIVEERDYIFSFVTTGKTGSVFRLEQRPLFMVVYRIAKHCPEVNVVVAGGTAEEARRKFNIHSFPKNLYFVKRGISDNTLRKLYENARLVVIPVFFRSVSNRLLEALYYGRPILTNSTAKLLHNKLEHLRHVFISDDYKDYPRIVRVLLKDDSLLEELSLGAKEAYKHYFSARRCGLLMKHVIETLIHK